MFVHPAVKILYFSLIFTAVSAFSQVQGAEADYASRKPVTIVYFSPADCTPLPDRAERLGRVMKHVQAFYRKGMESNGYGAVTFDLEWAQPDKLKLHEVAGKLNQSEYGRSDAYKVRNEVVEALKKEGGYSDWSYLVIFQQGLKWENGTAKEIGPYVGGGWNFSGTAWVFDDPLLDSNRLGDTSAGGYYYGRCSIGEFNSHYIGGIAHEMGHMFGLPHDCQTDEQYHKLGNALMGAGNHSYGNALRGQAADTFLSLPEAMRLSCNTAFSDSVVRSSQTKCEYKTLSIQYNESKQIDISGEISADAPLYGLVVYLDAKKPADDYDAKAWAIPVDKSGKFQIIATEWKSGEYEIRLAALHKNGFVSYKKIACVLTGENADFDVLEKNE